MFKIIPKLLAMKPYLSNCVKLYKKTAIKIVNVKLITNELSLSEEKYER